MVTGTTDTYYPDVHCLDCEDESAETNIHNTSNSPDSDLLALKGLKKYAKKPLDESQ